MPKKKPKRLTADPRTSTFICSRLRRDDIERAREWLKARKDPTLSPEDVDAMSTPAIFGRLVRFARSSSR